MAAWRSHPVCVVVLLLQFVHFSMQAKILLLPFSSTSHYMYLGPIGSELVKNGHTVHMVHSAAAPVPADIKKSGIITIEHQQKTLENANINDPDTEMEIIRMVLKKGIDTGAIIRQMQDDIKPYCIDPLSDDQLYVKLQENQYDFAILDAFIISRCLAVLLYKLNVPFATITTAYEPWLFGIPALPSFVPFAFRVPYTEKMTFYERLWNLYMLVDWYAWPRFDFISDSLVKKYAPEKPPISVNDIVRHSMLWMINTDDAIDYPRPTMPHVIYTGGLTTQPAKKVPEEYDSFLKDATNGAILVSFGSLTTNYPPEIMDEVYDAMCRVKQRVIWKYLGHKENVPNHIKMTKWLPQNDLLGHSKVKLFITHGGNNGQFEALYHSIPMLVLPIYSEREYNGYRIQYKGYGRIMQINNLSSEELLSNIDAILNNPEYEQNVKRGSKIFHSAPMTPQKRAVYWIEHVMKYGGDHLRSASLDMPWYQYWMIDILACLLSMILVLILILYKILKVIFRFLFKRNVIKKKTD